MKTDEVERPIELKIVVFLEAFVAVRYLTYAIAFLSISSSALDFAWMIYTALMIISILIAYGLWRLNKWVWLIAIALSLLGIVTTLPLLLISGVPIEMLWQYIPSIALDLLAIFLLLRKQVKGLFWGPRTVKDLPSAAKPPQNP